MQDLRHQKRIKLMQQLFAHSFSEQAIRDYLEKKEKIEKQDEQDEQDEQSGSAEQTEQTEQIEQEELAPKSNTIKRILQSLPDLDQEIAQVAPERPLKEINKVDLAILRLIVFESKHKKTPKKVLLDKAVELAKEFGTDSSSRFINGALAKLLLDKNEQNNQKQTTN